ncbi:hypothetical protein AVEN_269838-1 [Araneus ventricosus]|uniref:Uncharacterized protein n=1 Tax=Araneus ventricosus TaxID=182803 RepID=A0A4Y2CGH2_ARAVE|nr:hypothetical protein AVEN_269838-1 [Araneus ventricosus]
MLFLRLFGVLLAVVSMTIAYDDDRDALCEDITCEDYECQEADDCEFGEVPDVCECCYTCAKMTTVQELLQDEFPFRLFEIPSLLESKNLNMVAAPLLPPHLLRPLNYYPRTLDFSLIAF